MTLPNIVQPSQKHNWRCAVTALEYATGIDRETIAKQIGHEGKAYWKSIRDRLGSGGSMMSNEINNRVGVLAEEIRWWAYTHYKKPVHFLTSRELIEANPNMEDRLHSDLFVPTRAELYTAIKNKVAIVSVPMEGLPNVLHMVAWLGSFALDPTMGRPKHLTEDEIRMAHILTEEDANARIEALMRGSAK